MNQILDLPPAALSHDDQHLALLGNLHFKFMKLGQNLDPKTLWVDFDSDMRDNIYLRAGVGRAVLQGSLFPLAYLKLTPAMEEVIKGNCIYPDVTSDKYYLSIEGGRLRVRYQHIIGSRLVCELSKSMVSAITTCLASQLMEYAAKHAPAAKAAPANSDAVIGELRLLSVVGDKILLPTTHLHEYAAIKSMLLKAGGKYNSRGYFQFPVGIDPDAVLSGLTNGQALNVRKETQSFFTPRPQAEQVCRAVAPAGKRIFEPSAGNGALVDEALRQGAREVVMVENFPANAHMLRQKGYAVIEQDFLSITPQETGMFDAVVANPPFTKGQDIAHVMHMWGFVKPGGVLSAIMSATWKDGSQRKQVEFASFLSDHGATVTEIEAGAFKESGTGVKTLHVVVRKPL